MYIVHHVWHAVSPLQIGLLFSILIVHLAVILLSAVYCLKFENFLSFSSESEFANKQSNTLYSVNPTNNLALLFSILNLKCH